MTRFNLSDIYIVLMIVTVYEDRSIITVCPGKKTFKWTPKLAYTWEE